MAPASVVLPTPGTSSINTWPRHRMAIIISSMALSILPLLLLYVSPVLFFVCAKCLLKCARMLPIAAFGGRLFKGKVRFAKFLSYLLLLISLPVSYLYAYAVAVLASMALASVVLWFVVYGFCSLAFGKDSVKLSSSDGNVRILLEKDWCGNYSAEVSEKGEKTKTYYSEDDFGSMSGTIAPGKKMKGSLAFEVKKNYKKLELDFALGDLFGDEKVKFVNKK